MNKVKNIISADSIPAEYSFKNASGPIRYNMTNDYMFKKALISSPLALKGLVASLLYTRPKKIRTVEVKNPILLGQNVTDKECRLDVLVEVNGHILIDMEMQVKNEHNWPERTLIYQCRTFDNIKRGEDYSNIKDAFTVDFLNFTLFEHHPEFHANYGITNLSSKFLFTNKFKISVIELNQTKLATWKDKFYHLDKWAKLFTATTWEEVKMIAKDNEYLESLAEAVHMINLDPYTARMLKEREEIISYNKAREKRLAEQEAQLAEQASELAEKDALIEQLKKQLEEKNNQ